MFPDGIKRSISPPPGQGNTSEYLEGSLGIRKGIAANPGSALQSDHIAVGVELRLALVAQCRFHILFGAQRQRIERRIDQLQAATLLCNLLIADRIQQLLDQLDIVGIDDAPGADPALGIGLDRKQLLRIDASDLPAAAQGRPQRRQHAGGEDAPAQLIEEVAPAVVEIVFADVHENLAGYPIGYPETRGQDFSALINAAFSSPANRCR